MNLKVRFDAQENELDPFCILISTVDEVWRFCPINLSGRLIELVRALIAVMNDSPSAKVLWMDSDSPGYVVEFQFLSNDDDMQFRIVKFENPARTQDKTVFEFLTTRFELVIAFWRGLRDLQGRYSEQEYQELQTVHWRTAFPTDNLEKLTQMIKKAKKEKDS